MSKWPDPTPEMLESAAFEAVWQRIKTWDINVPNVYVGYMGATGNHVRAILDALESAGIKLVPPDDTPSEAARRAGGSAPPIQKKWRTVHAGAVDVDPAWAAANERNRQEATDERMVALREVTDVAMTNEFLAGLERQYADYSEVELKLVDPRTVTHIRRDVKQTLSEVIDAPAAIAVIITVKNHTQTPYYIPLKLKPNPLQLTAMKEYIEQKMSRGNVKMLGMGCD